MFLPHVFRCGQPHNQLVQGHFDIDHAEHPYWLAIAHTAVLPAELGGVLHSEPSQQGGQDSSQEKCRGRVQKVEKW